jgi:hypothetical protein
LPKRNANNRPSARRFCRLVFQAAIFPLVIFCCAGCGSSLHYNFPKGKTLVYEESTIDGVENLKDIKGVRATEKSAGRFLFSEASRKGIELDIKQTTAVSNDICLIVSAHPLSGTRHAIVGADLGSITITASRAGEISNVGGMSALVNERLIFRRLPDRRVRRGAMWNDSVNVNLMRQEQNINMKNTYEGVSRINGRACYHIRGVGEYKREEDFKNAEKNIFARFSMKYRQEEDLYLLPDGYPLKSVIQQIRERSVKHLGTGEILYGEATILKYELNLMGIK